MYSCAQLSSRVTEKATYVEEMRRTDDSESKKKRKDTRKIKERKKKEEAERVSVNILNDGHEQEGYLREGHHED